MAQGTPPEGGMVLLTTVVGSFHGRVLSARLGTEGVLAELSPPTDGPYPLQREVDVLVRADQLELAREILLADAVDAAFDPPWPRATRRGVGRTRQLRRRWRRAGDGGSAG